MALGALMVSLVAAFDLGAFDLRGTLQQGDSLSPGARPEPRGTRGFYWEVPNGVVPISAARANLERDVGVVLTGPGVAESTQPVTIALEGGRCRPGTVVVSPGTTLSIDNQDLLAHELYAVREGQTQRAAPAELTSPRTRRQMTFPGAGTYEVRDVRQSSLRCWVVVGPGQGRVLRVDAAGAFTATGLNNGDYTVKVYFEGHERASQAVTVSDREAEVQVSLAGAAAAPAADAEHGNHHRRGED